MNLYLFNPSHDEALAADTPYYYPTTIARRLAVEWGAVPALWAGPGNVVWVPDEWEESVGLGADTTWCTGVRFVRTREMNAAFWEKIDQVEPWGWDPLVRRQLQKAGAPAHLLPSDEALARLRRLSSRETTVCLLPLLKEALSDTLPVVGESQRVETMDEADALLQQWQGAMVKSLWSCSGRGVFRVPAVPSLSERGRIARLLREQGAVEMEPYYQGVMDFALEFYVDEAGQITYEGLSLFRTNPLGGYSGNVVTAPEHLQAYVSAALGSEARLEAVVHACLAQLPVVLGRDYAGPLGIDMMQVETPEGKALLPCVEVNVRRTMGHVALSLLQRKLKEEELPYGLRKLWYFCNHID